MGAPRASQALREVPCAVCLFAPIEKKDVYGHVDEEVDDDDDADGPRLTADFHAVNHDSCARQQAQGITDKRSPEEQSKACVGGGQRTKVASQRPMVLTAPRSALC